MKKYIFADPLDILFNTKKDYNLESDTLIYLYKNGPIEIKLCIDRLAVMNMIAYDGEFLIDMIAKKYDEMLMEKSVRFVCRDLREEEEKKDE